MIKYYNIKRMRGMTLVELVISMTILSLILAFATSLFIVQQKSTSRQQQHMQLVQRGRGTLNLLQYRLREIRTITSGSASRIVYTDADGLPFSFFLKGNSLWMTDIAHSAADSQLVANEVSRFSLQYNNTFGQAVVVPVSLANLALIRQIGITLVFRSAIPMYSAYPESLSGFVSLRDM
jgi:prepilin-type N-terminal cleavage/methylation domain-containing protein